jgi:TolB-like protein/DNA-binding SARP family transcriptional activator
MELRAGTTGRYLRDNAYATNTYPNMIQLLTLGATDLRQDGGDELRSVLSQPKRLALLVHVALGSPSGFVGRDTLLALFWPESDEERARNSLRQSLHFLRRSIGENAIVNRGDREIGLSPEHIRCDAVEFESALRNGRMQEALELYRGDFLPGMHVEDSPELERWIEDRRSAYRRSAVEAATALADREAASGEVRAALLWARRAVALDPCAESATRRLMSLLERAGEPAEALSAFHDLEARLRAELALGASEETVRLASAIRRRTNAGAAHSPEPAPAGSEVPVTYGAAARSDQAAAEASASPAHTGSGATSGLADGPADSAPPRQLRRRAADRRRPWLSGAIVAAVLVAGFLAWRAWSPAKAPLEGPASVAVLPFLNMSGDPANEYFSDGMTEELLNVLSRVPDLNVAARTSSFAFKGRDVPVDSIGRTLSVTHVVEGSVRATGDRVRITAQLIDTRTGYHLWSETYDRRLNDVFEVQDEIATAIAKVL